MWIRPMPVPDLRVGAAAFFDVVAMPTLTILMTSTGSANDPEKPPDA